MTSDTWKNAVVRGVITLIDIQNLPIPKTLDHTTQYRKTNHWPILLKLWRSSSDFDNYSSNRKPTTTCNPYMIGSCSNELRHHKFSTILGLKKYVVLHSVQKCKNQPNKNIRICIVSSVLLNSWGQARRGCWGRSAARDWNALLVTSIVLVLEGNSEIGVQLRSRLCYVIC